MNRTLIHCTLAAAIGLATAGCQSTLTGNEGNLQFSYDADDRITDFNKPIAVGAFLDLEVRDVGARQPVQLSSASFDDESILTVADVAGNVVTVKGVGEGGALLSVEGETVDGEVLTDSINLLARVPEVLVLNHTCSTGSAHYLANQRVWVPFEMEMSNSQPVIGYGYYPMALSAPVAVLNEADSGSQFVALDTASAAGVGTLDSQIDGTSLDISVVLPTDIDGVSQPIAWVLEDIDVGDTNAFYVLPEVGGSPVCQADVNKVVTSDTPDICTVADRAAPPGELEFGWFDVTGVAEGTCLFTVSYPDSGTSEQFSYPIEP